MARSFASWLAAATLSLAPLALGRGQEVGDSGFSWQRTDDRLALCHDGKVVWQLVADPKEPKAWFHPLATVDGEVLTASRPADHPWHHGLWWSWKFINGLNYWEEDPQTGKSEGITTLTGATFKPASDFSARAVLSVSYHPPGQASVMTEERTLKISRPDDEGRYRIDWTSVFTAGDAAVTLGRTPLPGEPGGKDYGGYAGLSLRLVLQPDGWSVRTSGGPATAADGHGKSARWVDFSAAGPGVAIFDHPDNLRHPSPWYLHDRAPMSFFSPALLFHEPRVLDARQSLKLRYRVLVHSKALGAEQVEAEYRAFAAPTKPKSPPSSPPSP